MRILVVNDDGYKSELLWALAKWATKLGEVTVIAPKTQQSGKSQSVELHDSFQVREIEPAFPEIKKAYFVDSTPADCVRFAYGGLNEEYDLVLSGINYGFNVGSDIAYSGTVGAIFEAAFNGSKAIAFSSDFDNTENSLNHLDKCWDFVSSNKLFDYNQAYNINIPVTEPKGILLTRQGGTFYRDRFVPTHKSDMFIAQGYVDYKGQTDFKNDLDALMHGYISVSPLDSVRTNLDAFNALKHLQFQ